MRDEMLDHMVPDRPKPADKPDMVNHPPHYKTASGLEVIDVIESFGLDRCWTLANAVKYILRCNKKGNRLEDLRKARFYLDREIVNSEKSAKS